MPPSSGPLEPVNHPEQIHRYTLLSMVYGDTMMLPFKIEYDSPCICRYEEEAAEKSRKEDLDTNDWMTGEEFLGGPGVSVPDVAEVREPVNLLLRWFRFAGFRMSGPTWTF